MRYIHDILIRIALLASLCALVASCSETIDEPAGDVVVASFEVSIPQEMQSRFIGEELTANKLLVGIYDEYKEKIEQKEYDLSGSSARVELALVKNQEYNFIFWAYNTESSAYDLSNLKAIKMNGIASSANDDVFVAVQKDYVGGESASNVGVTLSRPLAQINVGRIGTQVETSLTLLNIPNEYRPFEQACYGGVDMTLKVENPTGTFMLEGDEYNYLAMAYVFASNAPKETDIIIALPTENFSTKVSNLPLQANHRYNVVGEFTNE